MEKLNMLEVMTSPLTQTGRSAPFLRLVLAEALQFGMPAQVVATLDDIAALLGFYAPLSVGQAAHLAGPLVTWRTDRRQPTLERVSDVEALAMKQRALIAFGGAAPGHMVGTAEIVCALGNTHKETMPTPYYELWTWAATDVQHRLTDRPKEVIRKDHSWPAIGDEEVLQPGGRLHATYSEVATHIRRTAIAVVHGSPDEDPRARLRPLAEIFLRDYEAQLRDHQRQDRPMDAALIEEAVATMRRMFPDLKPAEPALPPDNAEQPLS